MRTSIFVAALVASSTALARQSPPAWADWGQRDTLQYLQAHNVPNPGNLNSDQLKELAKRHWEETATGAQVHFEHLKASAYDAYSDSELRKYLLDKGIVSPQSKREELIQLAKENGFQASKTVDSAWAKATDAVEDAAHAVADNASAAFYAVVDAPGDAYDYVAAKFDGSSSSFSSFSSPHSSRLTSALPPSRTDSKDYVYSTWTDSDLHSWAVSKGLVEPTAPPKQRADLLALIKKPYNEASAHVYDSWSDSTLVRSVPSFPPSSSPFPPFCPWSALFRHFYASASPLPPFSSTIATFFPTY